ncbi:sensor histidine kinase [Secundilactobacillus muriivasis]
MTKATQPVTTAKAIQRNFFVLFTLVTLMIGIAVVGVVGVQLVRERQQESVQLLSSLKRSIIDDRPDWNEWRKSSTINTKNTYVRVHNAKIGKAPGTYYSKGTQKFLARKRIRLTGPLFPAVSYVKDAGFFYYRAGTRLGIRSEIWLSLNNVMTILLSVIMTVAVLLLIGITIGGYFITLIAQKLTKPLAELSQVAQAQSETNNDYAEPLPTPATPVEAQQLATSFNKLLSTINAKNQQEKAFVDNAAHELRTPIAVILGHSKLIQRRGADHPEIVAHSVDFITDEATRMQQLVNQLLVLSRADRAQPELSYINLSDIVFETVEEERAVLPQTISVTGDQAAIAYTNADNVQQILRALIDNAGKYSPKDSLIQVQLTTTAANITLSIKDQGPGIPADEREHVFDRFYRGNDARDQRIDGTGLGLSIAKRLATLNRIGLSLAPVEPTGTVFTLTFANPKQGMADSTSSNGEVSK